MKTAPFHLNWFLYWLITGKGHPDHIKWWADYYARERRNALTTYRNEVKE